MAAEEVVDRKEYEMAVGRFGGISFQEISAEEADKMNTDRSAAAGSGGINFTEEVAAPVNSESINFTEEMAAPVSSGSIVNKYGLDFSSATIRNEMAELEKIGFLDKPHTSSGRVPSEQGYRYYVDNLMDKSKINKGQKKIKYK